MDAPAKPVKPLDYAPAPKNSRRVLRTAFALFGIAVAATIAFLWIPALYRYAEISYWARQCLNYQPPQNYLVYDCNFRKPFSPGYCLSNPALNRFQALFDSASQPNPTLFLHRMTRPDGQTRLVACSLAIPTIVDSINFPSIVLWTFVWEPSASLTPWQSIPVVRQEFDLGSSARLKIYAGAVDPGNPSHLIIPMDIDGQRNTIDGWLKNDDSVLLGPITPVSTPNPSSH